MRSVIFDNRYEVLKKLSSGAMGEVYKVRDLKDNKIIALKILSKQKTSSEVIQRFKREFSLLAELHHPNLCAVYDFGTLKDGRSYFTMEYIEGRDIFSTIKELPEKNIYPLIVQLCRVLEYIHAKGLIHYDIKPGNVLVQDGAVKLTDFGLADEQRIKGGAFIKGTFPYIAPEVIKGLAIDQRADLYSMGVLLYEIYTHKRLKALGEDSFATLLKKLADWASILPLKIASDIPGPIGNLISKLIAFEPVARFNRANEVITEINKIAHTKYEVETEETLEGYLLSSKFVGREKEMDLLRQYYEKARQGEGKVILISGDAGVGKSRLLGEFKVFTQLQRGHCFMGAAHKEKTRPLEPFYNIFSELINYLKDGSGLKMSLAVLFKIFPDLADGHLRKHLPKLVPLDPESERIRTFDALTELIKFIVLELGELVILLEDLHWAEDLTIQFLEYLGRNLEDSKIFICGTCRKEVLTENPLFQKIITNLKSSGYFQQLELRPLNFKNLYSFLDSTITSKSNSPSLVKYLMQKTGGNPYFVEEIMRTLLRTKKVSIGEKIEIEHLQEISIPETLEEVVLKRFGDLDKSSKQVVKFGAVLLKDFDYDLIKRLTNLEGPELSMALWDLKRRQILIEKDNRYRFYHATLREALNKRMGDNERRALNYQIGKTLEKINRARLNTVIEDLAYYFINAQDTNKGTLYGLKAAQRSRERYANEQAINFYEGVLEVLDHRNTKLLFNILHELAQVEKSVGYYEDAIKHYKRALRLKAGTANQKIYIYLRIGGVFYNKGEYNKELSIYRRAIQFLKHTKSSTFTILLETLIKVQIGVTWHKMGDYKHVSKLNLDSLKFTRAEPKGNEEINLLGDIYNGMGIIESHRESYGRPNYDKAISYYTKAYRYYKKIKNRHGIGRVRNNLGVCYLYKKDYQNALGCFQNAIEIFEKIGELAHASTSLHSLGSLFINRGYCIKALDYFKKALRISTRLGDSITIGSSAYGIGLCLTRLGDHKSALKYLEKALIIFQTIGLKERRTYPLDTIGEVYQALCNYDLALRFFRKSLKIAKAIEDQPRIAITLNHIGSVFIDIGVFSSAKRYIDKALKIAVDIGIKQEESICYMYFCYMNLLMKEYAVAHNFYERGIKLAKKSGKRQLIGLLFILASRIYYHDKKYSKGIKLADRSIKMASDMGAKDLYVEALLIKAKNEIKCGILSKIEIFQILDKAKEIAEEIGCPEILWKTYYEYGRFLQDNQDYLKALEYFQKCNVIFEDVIGKIKNESYRKSYLNHPDRQAVFAATNEIEKLLG